jgi:hypothetical protein
LEEVEVDLEIKVRGRFGRLDLEGRFCKIWKSKEVDLEIKVRGRFGNQTR